MKRAVALARREGFDWGRIGRNLGMSRQGARQKFPAAPPAPPPHVARRSRMENERLAAERMATAFQNGTLGRTLHPYEQDDDPVAW